MDYTPQLISGAVTVSGFFFWYIRYNLKSNKTRTTTLNQIFILSGAYRRFSSLILYMREQTAILFGMATYWLIATVGLSLIFAFLGGESFYVNALIFGVFNIVLLIIAGLHINNRYKHIAEIKEGTASAFYWFITAYPYLLTIQALSIFLITYNPDVSIGSLENAIIYAVLFSIPAIVVYLIDMPYKLLNPKETENKIFYLAFNGKIRTFARKKNSHWWEDAIIVKLKLPAILLYVHTDFGNYFGYLCGIGEHFVLQSKNKTQLVLAWSDVRSISTGKLEEFEAK